MRPPRSDLRRFALLSLVAMLGVACAQVEGDDIGTPIFNGTTPDGIAVEPPITTLPTPEVDAIRVPLDFFSIQEAVDVAQPGDLVLIEPGVYSEEVVVRSPDVVIRGRDRNTVFIDGLHAATTGFTVTADGVAIENLTVRNYTTDAVAVMGTSERSVDGFRALHITTSNTGRHGVLVSQATNVEVREGWMSGAAGAGVAIESCVDCATLIETTLSEFSARGFSVVGATDGVQIIRSTSRNNRAGIVLSDGGGASTRGAAVAGTVIQNNGFSSTPRAIESWDASFGVGLHVSGTVTSDIRANRVSGNTRAGILVGAGIEPGTNDPIATTVIGNEATGHLEGDIVLAFANPVADPQLCVADNAGAVLLPEGSVDAVTCVGDPVAPPTFAWAVDGRSTIPYANGPVPPGIEGMADADSAPAVPAGPVIPIDLSTVLLAVA
ncbi:MAG: right-handed parallel beta-helix repeat-containing protein [Acidimicrobiales bacterium]